MPPKRSGKSKVKSGSSAGGAGAKARRLAKRALSRATPGAFQARENKRSSGFSQSTTFNTMAGTEDSEDTTMRWEYVITSALAAASDLTYCVKGNSIYQPGGIASVGLGVTTNPVGYARMYQQYKLAHVQSSTIHLTAWGTSGTVTGGVPTGGVVSLPLRLAVVPAQSTAAIAYAALPTATIAGAPHARSAFRNNTTTVRNGGDVGLLLTGLGKQSESELVAGDYSAATGGDPSAPWYYTIGLGNPNAAFNCTTFDLRISIVYKVRWYEPNVQATQLALTDRHGNELSHESKGDIKSLGFKSVFIDQSSLSTSAETKKDSPGTDQKVEFKVPRTPSATQGVEALLEEEDDDDEAEFLAYLKAKFKARSQFRQAAAFENCDFSGVRAVGTGLQ